MTPHKRITALKQCIQRITTSKHQITISIMPQGLIALIRGEPTSTKMEMDTIDMVIPASLRRCGIETRLIITSQSDINPHQNTVKALQEALGKALTWQQALFENKANSMSALAKQEGVTQRYIAHIIKLATLAPDIMALIIKGDIPSTLTLGRLKKGFSINWEEQYNELNFKNN